MANEKALQALNQLNNASDNYELGTTAEVSYLNQSFGDGRQSSIERMAMESRQLEQRNKLLQLQLD